MSLICKNSSISSWSISKYAAKAPLLTPPCDTTSIEVSNNFMKETAPEDLPLSVTAVPLCLSSPKYPEVPPPILVCMITSPILWVIPSMLSGTWTLKHEIGSPLCVPIFAHTGDEKEIHPLTIISLKASFNSGLYSLLAAASVILSIAPSNVSPFSKYPLLSICSDSSLNHQMFVFSSITFFLCYINIVLF